MSMDPERRSLLIAAKLAALIKPRWGDGDRTPVNLGGGAGLLEDGVLWVLAEDAPLRSLGAAITLGVRHQAQEVHLIAGSDAGVLARRAAAFIDPPQVWAIAGTDLVPADPKPIPAQAELPEAARVYEEIFLAAGAEPVVEFGVLRAEVLGLEVARVAVDHEGAYLEVGVGKHDREAQRLVHGDRPSIELLASAIASVKERRTGDALPHQINKLAAERWLRALAVLRPHAVGAQTLWPVAPPFEQVDLRQPRPAPAAGESVDGSPVMVVCSTGVDVDLVPSGVDSRAADPRQPRLRLVVPEGDDHPLTKLVLSRLVDPADLVVVPATWKDGLG